MIAMSESVTIDNATIQQWIAARLDPQTIEADLISKGFDLESVKKHLKSFRHQRNAKKQVNGFICMAIGALLGFISCVLTIINPVPSLYEVILYGLTSVSICIIMLGLYFVFE